MARSFNIIVAVDAQFGIGKNGAMPWHLPAELKRFKALTTHPATTGKSNMVIMGRKTWDSLPEQFKPLPGRVNCVITRNVNLILPEGVIKAGSLQEALDVIKRKEVGSKIDEIFVIGGAQIFVEALKHPLCERIYLTKIRSDFNCDTFFPADLSNFKKVAESAPQTENNVGYSFLEFQKN